VTTVFATLDELRGAIGEVLGPGQSILVDQGRIQAFADATEDHQWIHLDAERAAVGPFGGTIAHGYLTLSLLPALAAGLYRVEGVAMGVNYGLNKVRFPSPVQSGSTVRASARIDSVEEIAGGVQVVATITVSVDGSEKPCCVAESVSRLYFARAAS
jgi:acyl dehydratase